MVGIRSYGGYVPRYRLDRKKIFEGMGWINAANIGLSRGEKAVANFDEDTITMAVAAALDCTSGIDSGELGGLYFASTTFPYLERQNAGIVAGALGMADGIRSADFAGSLKSGTTALIAALEAASFNTANNLVVCASDMRLGKMGSPQEMIFGDAAAAFVVSDTDVIAEYKGSFSISCDFVDHYRGSHSVFDRQWEDRWIRDAGFDVFIPQVVQGLLEKYSLKIADFAKVIYPCHYPPERKKLNKMLAIEDDKVQDTLLDQVGEMGAAQSLIMFARALEDASPGDNILLVSYGSGCDALWFQVTDKIKELSPRKGVSGALANRAELDRYEKYLAWRRITAVDIGMRGEEDKWTRWSLDWRHRKAILGFTGAQCLECGAPHFPPQAICVNPTCGAVEKMADYRFVEKGGRIFSYTGDNLAASFDPPQIYGNIDFNGGGRYLMAFTDCKLDSVAVGMPVEFSFRVVYYDPKRDLTRYFWKAVPKKEV